MKSGLSGIICFLLNTLNDINSFSSISFLVDSRINWPGAVCVILAALFECSTLVFHGNLPGLPSYIKNVPEIFFRQVFRTIWGQIYGLPGLVLFSNWCSLPSCTVTNRLGSTSSSSEKSTLSFFLLIWDRGIYWMFTSSVSLTVLSPSKNFNHWKLSNMLKYFRNYLHSSYVTLRYRNVSDAFTSLLLCSSLLYICICVDSYLVFFSFVSFPRKQHVQKEAVCVYLSKVALIHSNVALKHPKSWRFAWSNAKMWKLLNLQQLLQITEEWRISLVRWMWVEGVKDVRKDGNTGACLWENQDCSSLVVLE